MGKCLSISAKSKFYRLNGGRAKIYFLRCRIHCDGYKVTNTICGNAERRAAVQQASRRSAVF